MNRQVDRLMTSLVEHIVNVKYAQKHKLYLNAKYLYIIVQIASHDVQK